MKLIAIVLVLLACLHGATAEDNACRGQSFAVAQAGNAAAPNPLPDRYNAAEVTAHISGVPIDEYPWRSEDNLGQISCVDARSDFPIVGAPGGDIGLWLTAQQVYWEMRSSVEPTFERIYAMFADFIDNSGFVSDANPFYFHTDDARTRNFLRHMSDLLNTDVTVFPWTTPANSELWLQEFVSPEWQGCGHIRLMLERPGDYNISYPVNSPGVIQQRVLQSFIRYFWSGRHKNRLEFSIKLGPLLGKAVLIVGANENARQSCRDRFIPTLAPNQLASQVFVYTPAAVAVEHEQVYRRFYAHYERSLDIDTFIDRVNALHTAQLGATIGPDGLNPANQIDLFSVVIDGEEFDNSPAVLLHGSALLAALLLALSALLN